MALCEQGDRAVEVIECQLVNNMKIYYATVTGLLGLVLGFVIGISIREQEQQTRLEKIDAQVKIIGSAAEELNMRVHYGEDGSPAPIRF